MSIKDEAEILRKKLEEEKENPIKIALFGQPGAGKSSIINKLVGSNKAEVGVRTDVTIDAQIIKWNDLILVDLPGYGTSRFPKNGYFDKFDLNDYDLFLCVFSGKFHEADTEFFQEIRDAGKTALLIRNQCDMLWEEGKTFEDLVKDITADAQKHVQSNEEIYFTSCRNNLGFDKLQTAIYQNIDASKRERWARSAKAYSLKALDKKREACQKDIYVNAGLSAANALNPIPGADVAVDIGILVKLFKDIKNDYGLTDEKLSNEHLVEKVGPIINNVLKYGTKEGVLMLLKQFAGRETIKTVSKYVPFIGTALAASIGFAIIKYSGDKYLEDCHIVAKEILEEELKV